MRKRITILVLLPACIIAILLLLRSHCINKRNTTWQNIEATVANSWENYVSTNSEVPYPFSDALESGILYYWDLYFIQKGLLLHGKYELAKYNVDNLIFLVDKYGYVPNATVSWGYDRSQFPFLSMIVCDYYFSQSPETHNLKWLKKAYIALRKEYEFWTDSIIEDHNTDIYGLQRYGQHAHDSVLIGVYDALKQTRFKKYPEPQGVLAKKEFGANVIAECESGYDFTPRFQRQICNYVPVELNANLWMYEMNFIKIEQELDYYSGIQWQQKADRRKDLINKYCWDENRGAFVDYNYVTDTLNPVISYATFYPMLWGFATQEQAKRIVKNLNILETTNGIRFCQHTTSPITYQWDHNSIWPPVQYVCYRALEKYGYRKDAERIAKNYLNIITKNYNSPKPESYMDNRSNIVIREPGNLYEKYNINGNILDYADYPAGQMIGWCGGVFSDALHFITTER